MKLFLSLAALLSGVSAFAPVSQQSSGTHLESAKSDLEDLEVKSNPVLKSAKSDLEDLAVKSNPLLKYYDPLNLVDADFWNQGESATIGFLRHAEIKHGRIAMFAFVGYCVQSNFVWPWPMTTAGDSFPSADLSPEAQWDAIPVNAKWQIFAVIAALEIWDESNGGEGGNHYMSGRKPGAYPSFKLFRENVHFVLDLYDPLGFNKKMSQEKKDKRLVMEINNGRLAMIGIFGFMAADAVPGSVPALAGVAQPYDGEIMAPFSANFHIF